MSINEVRYLPECGSTNAYVKEHFEEFGPVAAVYTKTRPRARAALAAAGSTPRARRCITPWPSGNRWPSLPPCRCWQALPCAPAAAALRRGLPDQVAQRPFAERQKDRGHPVRGVSYGYQQQGRGILCGIGINLAQPQSYFDAADLPHGTSLALQGMRWILPPTPPGWRRA